MITHKEIDAKVTSKELSTEEKDVLTQFDKLCSDKIEMNFAHQDCVYVGDVLFSDIFRANKIPKSVRTSYTSNSKIM